MSTGPYVLGTSHVPEPPLMEPRRRPWATNDTAVAVVLVGFLVLAAAASLYGTGASPDDVTSCPSLAAVDRVAADIRAVCAPWRDTRAHVVRGLAIAGVLLIALGAGTAPRRWLRWSGDRPATWSLVWWSLLAPVVCTVLAVFSVPDGQFTNGVIPGVDQVLVAIGALVACRVASLGRDTATRSHLVVAVAVAVPLSCAAAAAIESMRFRTTWPAEARFPYPDFAITTSVVLAATVPLFAIAVTAAKFGRAAPNVWVSGFLFVACTAPTVPVFVRDLVPAWRGGVEEGPGPSTWLPILLWPPAVTLLVWLACALRRDPASRRAFS